MEDRYIDRSPGASGSAAALALQKQAVAGCCVMGGQGSRLGETVSVSSQGATPEANSAPLPPRAQGSRKIRS